MELAAPERQVALDRGADQLLLLPGGVVAVLHGRRDERRRLSRAARREELRELAPDDPHRPAVRHDVVDDQEQRRRARRVAEERGADERPARELEGAPRRERELLRQRRAVREGDGLDLGREAAGRRRAAPAGRGRRGRPCAAPRAAE